LQRLLAVLADIAATHRVAIGSVAIAWVLAQPRVAGVIVGARHAGHLDATVAAATLVLDDADHVAIRAVLDDGPAVPGDVYALERTPGGRHAGVMRYDLNAEPGPGAQGSG
jgi:diketogulonate reductase-like aldo/keto reductase